MALAGQFEMRTDCNTVADVTVISEKILENTVVISRELAENLLDDLIELINLQSETHPRFGQFLETYIKEFGELEKAIKAGKT
jgi:hypothetical protein